MITTANETQNLQPYFRDIGKTPLLARSEEIELGRLVQQDDPAARERMITSNLRLVVTIAKKYSGMGVSLGDLIAEGNIGLMKAVDRFDPEAGFRFSTFAYWWIKQAVQKALSNQSRTIRVPSHATQKVRILRRVTDLLADDLGHDPTVEELSEVTGLAPEQIDKIHQTTTCTQSLDAPIALEGEGASLVDLLSDERAENPVEELSTKMRRAQLSKLLTRLSAAELQIVESRFGLGGRDPQTLDQIGQEFGLKRERVRQLESIAISKMRRAFARREENLRKKQSMVVSALACA
ncbi:MAG: RNA polymerase primary sigma factor [Verrucomicrobiales bacterium]|jgi:RNA polymerase primary sigma factor